MVVWLAIAPQRPRLCTGKATSMSDEKTTAERRARLLTRAGFALFWGLALWTIIAASIGVIRGVSQADTDGSGQWAETR